MDNNISNFLFSLDKITFEYACKTIEHGENWKYKTNVYSINKFNRYNSFCNNKNDNNEFIKNKVCFKFE
jgi:hypothetical protein